MPRQYNVRHRGKAELRNTCDAKKTLRYKIVNEKKTEAKKNSKKLLEKIT